VICRRDYYRDPAAPRANRIVPGGAAIVTDGRGRVLMHRRADSGNWSLPGGTILVSDESTEVRFGPRRRAVGVRSGGKGAGLGGGDEGRPVGGGDGQDWAGGVLGVAYADHAGQPVGDLDTIALAVRSAALAPGGAGQVGHGSYSFAVSSSSARDSASLNAADRMSW